MAKLSYKMSYYVFYVCVALILVVLGMFYGVGYTNPVGEYNEPAHTETLIYLMYGMFAVTVVVTVLGAIAQFTAALKGNPKGAVKSLLGVALLAVLLIVTYNMGSDASVLLGDGNTFTDAVMLKVSDMLIYSTYVLLIVASVATLVNLTGIFKQR